MSNHRIAWGLALMCALSACERAPAPTATADASVPAPAAPSAPAAPVEPPTEAAFVLPGPFAESTTVADFEQTFGKANVSVTEVRETDGRVLRSLVLFPEDPTRRATVSFHDPEAMTGVASILVNDAGSRWRGKGGVHVGMSFAELRAINGKPFYLSGFDDQRRGWVRDQWSASLDDTDATLGALDVGEGDQMYFGVDLGVRDGSPADAYPTDDAISSDDPEYSRLGEIVEVTAISAYTSLDDEW